MSNTPRKINSVTRRDFISLSLKVPPFLLALALIGCDEDEVMSGSSSEGETVPQDEELIAAMLLDQMAEDSVSEILSTSLPEELEISEEQSEFLLGLGPEIVRIGIMTTALSEGAKLLGNMIKISDLSEQIGDVIADLYPDCVGNSVQWRSKSKVFHIEGNAVDFVVKIPNEVTGNGDVWLKFVRAPIDIGSFGAFEDTLEVVKANGIRYGYISPEQADEMKISKAKIDIETGEETVTKEYMVYRTPNIRGVRFDTAMELGVVKSDLAKELYLEWYRENLKFIKDGDVSVVHQDPGIQNFFVQKDVNGRLRLVPYDYEGYAYAFGSSQAAAVEQLNIIGSQLEDLSPNKRGLRNRGLDITIDELRRIYMEVFDTLEIPRIEKIKIPIDPSVLPNIGVGRRVYLVVESASLKGFPNVHNQLKLAVKESIESSGRFPADLSVSLVDTTDTVKLVTLKAVDASIDVVDPEVLTAHKSLKMKLRKLGGQAATGVKILGNALELLGTVLSLNEIIELSQNPSVQLVHGSESARNKAEIIIPTDFVAKLKASIDELAGRLMMAAHQAENRPEYASLFTRNPDEKGRIYVSPLYDVYDPNLYPEITGYYELLLALRMLEVIFNVPMNIVTSNNLATMELSILDKEQIVNRRDVVYEFLSKKLIESGVWVTCLVSNGGAKIPGFDTLISDNDLFVKIVVNGNMIEISLAGKDPSGKIGPQIGFVFEDVDGKLIMKEVLPLSSDPRLFLTRGATANYVLDAGDYETIISEYNQAGVLPLKEL